MPRASWSAPYDPRERKDYAVNWSDELQATDDSIASVEFILPDEATNNHIDAALSLKDSEGMKAILWLDCSDPDACLAALNGESISIKHSITTTAGRELTKTIRLKIRQK